jgi:hypothetical protein
MGPYKLVGAAVKSTADLIPRFKVFKDLLDV